MPKSRKRNPARAAINPEQEFEKLQAAYKRAYDLEIEVERDLANYPDITPNLKFSATSYNTNALIMGSLSERNMRKEYARLRLIANKRIERMQRSELSNLTFAQENSEKFPTLSSLQDYEVAYELGRVVKFLKNPSSMLTYQRMRQTRVRAAYERKAYGLQIEEFSQGVRTEFDDLSDVTNAPEFVDWLDVLGASRRDRAFYESLLSLSGTLRKKHISFQDILQDAGITTPDALNLDSMHEAFDYYIKHHRDIQQIMPNHPEEAATSSKVRYMLNKYGK